jgi:hypothetical protein
MRSVFFRLPSLFDGQNDLFFMKNVCNCCRFENKSPALAYFSRYKRFRRSNDA